MEIRTQLIIDGETVKILDAWAMAEDRSRASLIRQILRGGAEKWRQESSEDLESWLRLSKKKKARK